MNGGPAEVDDTVEDGSMPPPAPDLRVTHPFALRGLTIVWPAFLMAGVLEMLTFAVVDPADLRWFGGESISWSSSAVYTVTFLIYWGVVSMSGALTALLSIEEAGNGTTRHWP